MSVSNVRFAPIEELIEMQARARSNQRAQAELDKLAFLRLLVAQIRHQDPMNPLEGTQFLSQLAQFSELEQLINLGQQLQAIQKLLEERLQAGRSDSSESPGNSSSQSSAKEG